MSKQTCFAQNKMMKGGRLVGGLKSAGVEFSAGEADGDNQLLHQWGQTLWGHKRPAPSSAYRSRKSFRLFDVNGMTSSLDIGGEKHTRRRDLV